MAAQLHGELRICQDAMYEFAETKEADPCEIMDMLGNVEADMSEHCIQHTELVEEWDGYYKTNKYCEKYRHYQRKKEEKARKRAASLEKKRLRQEEKEAKKAA